MLAVSGNPLERGEIECTIDDPDKKTSCGRHDWTDRWGWRVKLKAYTYPKHGRYSNWLMVCDLFLQDLPSQLRAGGVSWENAAVDLGEVRHKVGRSATRQQDWRRSSLCSPAATSPQNWQARVLEMHSDPSSIRDFRHYLSAETVYKARLCQRTGPGRRKVVMIYYLSTAYGNDLSGQRIDTWHIGLSETFSQFIRPLLPYDLHTDRLTS
ncbi:hypothetical protein ACJZ2D_000970 [Fusarium nematophilum]